MLPRKNRVNKGVFGEVLKTGRVLISQNLSFRYLNLPQNLLPPRLAVIVPAKTEKTSAGRHFLKRKISAVLEKNLLQIPKGFIGLVFVKNKIFQPIYQEIEKEVLFLLHKSGAIE